RVLASRQNERNGVHSRKQTQPVYRRNIPAQFDRAENPSCTGRKVLFLVRWFSILPKRRAMPPRSWHQYSHIDNRKYPENWKEAEYQFEECECEGRVSSCCGRWQHQ